MFPPLDYIDSWVYAGYQWDLSGHIKEFGPLYYESRLSWILPAAILHGVLPPVVANICFKILVSALLAVASGTIVYRNLGFRGALLAVVLSVDCPQIIFALHTDYIDTAVILYGILSLVCITLAKDSRYWPAWISAGGVFFTSMVIANLTALSFPGLGLVIYHLLWLRWNLRRQLVCLGLYTAAAVIVVAGLGMVNLRLGGDFLFMKPQFTMLARLSSGAGNPWAPKDWHWFREATWLVIPTCALIWGIYRSLIVRSTDPRIQMQVSALTAALLTSLAVATILEIRGQPVLNLYFYASFHLCLAVPLLAICCATSASPKPASLPCFLGQLLFLAVIIIVLDPLLLGERATRFLPFAPPFNEVSIVTAVLLPLVVLFFILSQAPLLGGFLQRALSAEVFLLGIVASSIPLNFHSPNVLDRPRERYAAVHSAFGLIKHEFPSDSYRLWEHPAQWGSRPLASAWLWGYRLFTQKPFPQFEAASVANLANRTLIITAPAGLGEQTLTEAKMALSRYAEISHERIIPVPGAAGTGFDLVTFSLAEKSIEPQSQLPAHGGTSALLDLDSRSYSSYVASLEKNLYGPPDLVRSALTTTAGVTWFQRTDTRDHLATAFLKLTSVPPNRRQLLITVEMPCDSQTLLVVQDQTFESLQQISLRKAGRRGYEVDLPASSQSIRLYFMSPTDSPTALPLRVQVYESAPPPPEGTKP